MPKDGRDLEDFHAPVWEPDFKERNVQSMTQDVTDRKKKEKNQRSQL